MTDHPAAPLPPDAEDQPASAAGAHEGGESLAERVLGLHTSLPPALEVHHIGIAVERISEAMLFYGDKLGLDVVDRRDLPERQLKVAFVQAGNTLIELMEPTSPDSTVARYIERRGPGLHHVCFGTTDIDEHLRDLKDKGVGLIDEVARPGAHGAVAFLQPTAAHGVLVELLQEGKDVPTNSAEVEPPGSSVPDHA